MPKQRFNPRATLYSPPPSHTRNSRVVAMRVSPGSSRSITSPRLTRSHRHLSFDLIFIAVITLVHHRCRSERFCGCHTCLRGKQRTGGKRSGQLSGLPVKLGYAPREYETALHQVNVSILQGRFTNPEQFRCDEHALGAAGYLLHWLLLRRNC